MTYQKYYEILYKEYEESSKDFLKLDKELSKTNGFGGLMDLPNYAKAKQRWQSAHNTFWGFLSLIEGTNINPNDELSLSFKRLKELLDSGAITEDEYNIQKAKILNS